MTTYDPNAAESIELALRVLSDDHLYPLDMLYVVGETKDNQESAVARAEMELLRGSTRTIGIWDGPTHNGYCGVNYTRDLMGPDSLSVVRVIKCKTEPVNTRTEAQDVIAYARDHDLLNIGITAPPFHQIRAFCTAVTIAVESGFSGRIYSVPGVPLSWGAHVTHSQGTLKGTRVQLIHEEWGRMSKYNKQGDLLPASDILSYLNARD